MSEKTMKKIREVGIVGAGTMGCGIAQVSAAAGYDVVMVDREEQIVASGRGKIQANLERAAKKGNLEAGEVEKILARVRGAADLAALAGCELVIEAVFEDLDTKKSVLAELESVCAKDAILASNTSSLCISKLGAGLVGTDRVVGMHFFNPVQVMALVEVVRTVNTSEETLERAVAFVKSVDKKPVVVRDQAGFVVNWILTPFLFDAVRALAEGVCSVQEIDDSLRYGCGHPMGPLALCDLIGLDVLVNAGNAMFEEYHEKKYAPPPLLKRLVDVGDYGVKSGRGFYDYRAGRKPVCREFA